MCRRLLNAAQAAEALTRCLVAAGLISILASQAGCYSYHRISPFEATGHADVRVTRTTGAAENLRWPQLAADTLYCRTVSGEASVAVPIDSIGKLESRHFDAVKSVGLISGAALVAVFATTVVPELIDDWNPGCC